MSIATRSRSSTIYCCETEETCIWHERWSPEAGGTCLTRHCVAMAWFPHEPIDFVAYCILYSGVNKFGNTGYKEPSHSRTAQKKLSLIHVSDQKWKLRLKKHWILKLEVQLQENAWQKCQISLWMIFSNKWKRNSKDFQVGSEDWNDVAFTGHRIRWTQDSP